jgi:hypothetical protein
LRLLVLSVVGGLVYLLFGASGAAATPNSALNWIQRPDLGDPLARTGAPMVYDPGLGRIVLFGGEWETTTFNGSGWSSLYPMMPGPPSFATSEMAYDPALGEVVLFGTREGAQFGETWALEGSTWTKLSPTASPPYRSGFAMAYDADLGEIVMFGGLMEGARVAETWAFDGSAWTKLSPTESPPARDAFSMAYDPAIGEIVLFGGFPAEGALADTWAFDGSTWRQLSPGASPAARGEYSMAYDPAIGEIVLFGGSAHEYIEADTWTFDGSSWIHRFPGTLPHARDSGSIAYDPALEEMVLFGGSWRRAVFADTWTYGPEALPSATITGPSEGQSFPLGATVPTSFSCVDGPGAPGISSCIDSAHRSSGAGLLDTSTLGPHAYSVTATSLDGEVTTSSLEYSVVAPSAPTGQGAGASTPAVGRPTLTITHRPTLRSNGTTRQRAYSFRFYDPSPGATYYCRLDKQPFEPCHSPQIYRHLKSGSYLFEVKSVDPDGRTSPTRSASFRVSGRRR